MSLRRFQCICLVFIAFASSAQIFDDDEFLPVSEAYPTEVELTADGNVLARWVIPDGYYLYKHSLKLLGVEGTELGTTKIPTGVPKTDEFFGDVEVFYSFLEISAPVLGQSSADVVFEVHFQGCADAGLCYPPEAQKFRLDGRGGGFSAEQPPVLQAGELSLWIVLLSAFLAGLILNLMPCVFPIVSIKALSLLQATDDNQLRHAMAYLVGVVATFLVLSLLLIALRAFGAAVGWGFQLQSPGFVAVMALLFYLMSMNMLGVIEIPGFGVSMSRPNPFLTGVLAVIVATPCTVPFMAAAIGYAITQGGINLILVMAMMGIGMAVPYVAVTATPQIAKWLPRPGPWMVTLKRVMSVPLILTVVWLVWVLARQTGVSGIVWAIGAMVVLTVIVLIGRRQLRWLTAAWGIMLVVIAGAAYAVSLPTESKRSSDAVAFEFDAFQRQVANARPIFLNVTADWCLTCLANERTTLSREGVQASFAEHGVTYVKVDWTNRDAEVTRLLEQFGRYGVPTYVLYPAMGQPVLLPQVLTPAVVDEYLQKHVVKASGS